VEAAALTWPLPHLADKLAARRSADDVPSDFLSLIRSLTSAHYLPAFGISRLYWNWDNAAI